MQETSVINPGIIPFLAYELIAGTLFALLVRGMAKSYAKGQTAWLVVVGVAFTVAIASSLIGLGAVAILALCFTASGVPMIVEYLTRVNGEEKADKEQVIAKLDEIARGTDAVLRDGG